METCNIVIFLCERSLSKIDIRTSVVERCYVHAIFIIRYMKAEAKTILLP